MDKYLNLPTFLISSYLIRLLITGSSIGDSIVMLVLGAVYSGYYYLEYKREPEVNKDIKNRIVELEEAFTKVKTKVDATTISQAFKR